MKNGHIVLVLAFTTAAAGVAPAQSSLVVPPAYDTAEALSVGNVAGFESRLRQQILIARGQLAPLQGKTIRAIWFRRDQWLGTPFQASTSNLTVRMAAAQRAPAAPSSTFTNNITAGAATVFGGTVSLPAAPPTTGAAPWSSQYAVQITFTAPYRYLGGDLVVEIEGEPQSAPPNSTWAVDYEHEADVGTVVPVGVPCGTPAVRYVRSASAWTRNMIPGGTFSLHAFGQPGTPGILMLGAPRVPLGLDAIGATGCTLYVQPVTQIVGLHDPVWGGRTVTAMTTDLSLPALANFLGAQFRVQWANVETGAAASNAARLTTTNALDITIAAALSPGNVATVISASVGPNDPFPASGRVMIGRAPVMRFDFD